MFDWLVETFTAHPYLAAAVVFLICGMGFPLPEELVLATEASTTSEVPTRPQSVPAASARVRSRGGTSDVGPFSTKPSSACAVGAAKNRS